MPAREDGEVVVLVPAAGQGRRLGGPRKQFRRLGGRTLLAQTLHVFERHPAVQHLVVAAPAGETETLAAALRADGITKLSAVVAGGDSRQASVRAALAAAPREAHIVLVHDAVRPFVQPAHVQAVIDAVREAGAAALAVPVTDTVRRGHEGVFGDTIPRDHLYRMQTPQGFRRAWLEAAFVRAEAQGQVATDDVALVQACGYAVRIVPGSPRNMKITTPEDWALATALWPLWEAEQGRRHPVPQGG